MVRGQVLIGAFGGRCMHGDNVEEWPKFAMRPVDVGFDTYMLPLLTEVYMGRELGVALRPCAEGHENDPMMIIDIEVYCDPMSTFDPVAEMTLADMMHMESRDLDRVVWVFAEDEEGTERIVYPVLRSTLLRHFNIPHNARYEEGGMREEEEGEGEGPSDFFIETARFSRHEIGKLLPRAPFNEDMIAESIAAKQYARLSTAINAALHDDPDASMAASVERAIMAGDARAVEIFARLVTAWDLMQAAAKVATIHVLDDELAAKVADGMRSLERTCTDELNFDFDPVLSVLMAAARAGNVAFLRLYEEIRPLPLDVVKWLPSIMAKNNLAVGALQYIQERHGGDISEEDYMTALDIAMRYQRVNMVRALYAHLTKEQEGGHENTRTAVEIDHMLASAITETATTHERVHDALPIVELIIAQQGMSDVTFLKLMEFSINHALDDLAELLVKMNAMRVRIGIQLTIFIPPSQTMMEHLLRRAYTRQPSDDDDPGASDYIVSVISQAEETTEDDIFAVRNTVDPQSVSEDRYLALMSGIRQYE